MSELKLWLLGSPRIELNGQQIDIPRQKALALLVYITLESENQARDKLATLFWGNSDQSTARASLRRDLSVLNKTLNNEWLDIGRESVGIRRNGLWIDVHSFQDLIESCGTGFDFPCLKTLGTAVDLYTDHFLTGFSLKNAPEFDDWQYFQAENLRQFLYSTLEKLVIGYRQHQQYAEALFYARRWLTMDMLNEEAHHAVVKLYAQNGQQSASIRQYQLYIQTMQDELDVEPSEEMRALYQQITTHQFTTVSNVSNNKLTPSIVHNIPIDDILLIGRDDDIQKITEHMLEDTCRLQTLTGTGGIGKTRLANRVGHVIWENTAYNQHFVNGIFYISLIPSTYPDQLYSTIADTIGIAENRQVTERERLFNSIGEQHILLILDNFEHLLYDSDEHDSAQTIIADIFASTSNLKILITSREPLNLQQEWIYPVQGLSFPDSKSINNPSQSGAVELFVILAKQFNPHFDAEPYWQDIIEICHLVEGHPLAIQLASSRVAILSPTDIVEELRKNLDFLSTMAHDIPQRHRTMRMIFEQTWESLTNNEQQTLLYLANFEGGFRWQAVQYITGANLTTLVDLTNKSIIHRDATGRYRLHELLRQFAGEKLNQSQQKRAIQNKHSRYYLDFLKQHDPSLHQNQYTDAIKKLNEEVGNIRNAWAYALTQHDFDVIIQVASSLYEFLAVSSRFNEGEAIFRQISTMMHDAGVADDMLFRLNIYRGVFNAMLGKYSLARELLQRSVSQASTRDNTKSELILSLDWLGKVIDIQGDTHEAELLYKESLNISRNSDDARGIASSLYNLGWIAIRHGKYAKAYQHFTESYDYYQLFDNSIGIAHALDGLGMSAFMLGQWAVAESCSSESNRIFERLGDLHGQSRAIAGQGLVAWGLGRSYFTRAKELLEESLMMNRQIDGQVEIARRLTFLGFITNAIGNTSQAEPYFQEALSISRKIGFTFGIPWALSGLGITYLEQGNIKQAQSHLKDALTIAIEDVELPIILDTLVSCSALWLQQIHKLDNEWYDKIMQLVVWLQAHESAWKVTRNRANDIYRQYANDTLEIEIEHVTLEWIEQEILDDIWGLLS